jgi:RimJ/RimL family protein N-acetyltransferase
MPIPMPCFDLPDGRLLRPLDESDAAELYALIEANRAHLARWMAWAARRREPSQPRDSERLGFRHEGTLRQAERIGERYRDQALYAMLAADWGR